MSRDDLFPVVIIGSGLAGLSTAVHLAARDIPVLILEADSEWPGGRLAGGAPDTFEYAGQTWSFNSQHGIHALWGGYDNMTAMFERFLAVELRPSAGEEWINRWGRHVTIVEAGNAVRRAWFPAPLHYLQLLFRPSFMRSITWLDFLSLPGFLVSLMWVTGLDPIEEEIDLDGLMIEEFFRGWTPNLRATFRGLGHSLLAAPSEQITLTAFIAAMRFFTMLRRDVWHLRYLPTNPHDCINIPMVERVRAADGDILYGAHAKSVAQRDDYWLVRFEDTKHGTIRTLEAQHVILAVDPPAAQAILTTSPDTAPAAAQMRFPSAMRNATVRMWYSTTPREGAPGGMFTGDFMVDNFFWLHRIQEDFIAWHEATGGSAIEVHLYVTDDVLRKPDELLIVEAVKEVQTAFPELRGNFVYATVRRNNATQTQFLIPKRGQSLFVDTPWPNLYACGDWVGYKNPALWMERCTITGMAAANHVLRNLGKPPFEIIPPRPPERSARLMGAGVRLGRRLVGQPILSAARTLRGKRQV
ncbi:MAG: FAD-dependent oxidoreductase [Anaerolineales bacterium]